MKRIGIIGAMDQEVEGLIQALENCEVKEKASMKFHSGSLYGKDTVVVKCGVGKVNASMCTQILIDDYDVSMVINTGAAGSLSKEVKIGDIVVATDAVQHDMDSVDFGFPLGQIPFVDTLAFPANEGLASLAVDTARKIFTDISVHRGRVCSGDEFIAKHERKDWIVDHFGGLCAEMEGASMAQTAYLNGVPFLIIRAISDEADDSASVDFPTFSAKASERGIALLKAMFEQMK